MNEPYVTVYRTYDPLGADVLGDVLRQHGIAARVLGTRHGAMLGAAQFIFELHIEVPNDRAGEAADLIEAFGTTADAGAEAGADAATDTAGGADADGDGDADADVGYPDGDDDEDDDEAAAAAAARRRPLLAAGSTIAIFGGSHMYCRRWWSAAVVAAAEIGAFVATIGGAVLSDVIAPFVVLISAFAYDLVGGQLAARAYNRGIRRSGLWQVLVTGGTIGGLAVGALLVAPYIPPPRQRRVQTAPIYDQVPLEQGLPLQYPDHHGIPVPQGDADLWRLIQQRQQQQHPDAPLPAQP